MSIASRSFIPICVDLRPSVASPFSVSPSVVSVSLAFVIGRGWFNSIRVNSCPFVADKSEGAFDAHPVFLRQKYFPLNRSWRDADSKYQKRKASDVIAIK